MFHNSRFYSHVLYGVYGIYLVVDKIRVIGFIIFVITSITLAGAAFLSIKKEV
jgi:hypothetical protein